MSRTERLLDLIQLLRGHRYPVAGAKLAEDLGVSLRTIYRDIGTLKAQGARIDGEPGLGYMLRPGFLLPPLMFSEEEIEALVLGTRWVAQRGDDRLAAAARSALTRVGAVLPAELRESLEANGLLVGPGEPMVAGEVDVSVIRQAIRSQRKVVIAYTDLKGGTSDRRTIWPFALAFFDHARVVVAWCEMREGFRHFRTDRIRDLVPTEFRYPRRRTALLAEWREKEGIPEL